MVGYLWKFQRRNRGFFRSFAFVTANTVHWTFSVYISNIACVVWIFHASPCGFFTCKISHKFANSPQWWGIKNWREISERKEDLLRFNRGQNSDAGVWPSRHSSTARLLVNNATNNCHALCTPLCYKTPQRPSTISSTIIYTILKLISRAWKHTREYTYNCGLD